MILCGALGSMIYFVSSFVSYVGNRTFRSSWFWFYISRPFVGGPLALIFYFIVGSGFFSGTAVTDLMKVAMVSALVGLFSDKAVKNLSDIPDVLLATKDDRKDKVEDKSKDKDAATGQKMKANGATSDTWPKVTSSDPLTIPPNAASTVVLRGSNLKNSKVKVGDVDAVTTDVGDQSLKVRISAQHAKTPSVAIKVATDQGETTFDLPIK